MARVTVTGMLLAVLAAFPGAEAAQANALKDRLSLFFDLAMVDSVTALEQKSETSLQITVVDPGSGETRNLREDVGAKPMAKLLAEANDLGLKTIPLVPAAEPADKAAGADKAARLPAADKAAGADSTEGKADTGREKQKSGSKPEAPSAKAEGAAIAGPKPSHGRSVSAERKNRMWYIANQTVLSTYVYGVSIPIALDVQSARVQIATPMIVAPFAFGAHFWFAKDRPFADSHYKGTTYLSYASLYASYAVPFSLMDHADDPYRVASFASLVAYPLGIWGGYLLGDQYLDLPGRIDTQEKFALGFGIMGMFSPFLYFNNLDAHIEAVARLGLGQSVVLATAGHFLADHYRTGQNIPDGVNTGIMDHTILGAGLGLEVAALADANAVRPWIGGLLLGGTVGFMEGLFYYRDSYDSQERGLYNTLGGAAGTLLGSGFAYLFYPDNSSAYSQKTTVVSLLVAGTWLGYWATNFLTEGMEDRSAAKEKTWSDGLAFNPMPFPEPQFRDREMYLRFHIPGVTYRF